MRRGFIMFMSFVCLLSFASILMTHHYPHQAPFGPAFVQFDVVFISLHLSERASLLWAFCRAFGLALNQCITTIHNYQYRPGVRILNTRLHILLFFKGNLEPQSPEGFHIQRSLRLRYCTVRTSECPPGHLGEQFCIV